VLGLAFWTFFFNAYKADEGSQNPGGLPNWWLLNGTLLVMAFLVFLQGCALIARSFLVFGGKEEYAGTSSH
jgi:TRAP-type mannitol/chloroaromatic compound transport system permease small subunit